MRKYLVCFFILASQCLSAQHTAYPATAIPDSLTQNAVSVVRNYSISFTQANVNNGVNTINKVVTILNKQGDRHAHFSISCDKFRELSKFTGVLRNASGAVIRKIKKGDLTHSNMDFVSLGSDDFMYYYECKSPTYPFTVEYSYEVKYKNGVISYPVFMPVSLTRQSLENATYKLELPPDVTLRSKTNIALRPEETKTEKNTQYTFSLDAMKAVPYEVMFPSYQDIFPYAMLAPVNFCFDSYCGSMLSWNDYGLWMNKLLEGRAVLPPALVSKLQEMVKDSPTDREKVKILYEYMQNNTRYVSIQLGIGGWQPFDAAMVAKTGFGDCKALTNFMLAMLKAVNIKSYYSTIYSGEEDKPLYEDYASLYPMNHVILLVPLQNDSLWLECTSQTLPFGFVHRAIADHDAVVMTEEGGRICRVPDYREEEKLQSINLQMTINEDATVKGNLLIEEHLDAAVDLGGLISAERERKVKYITSYLKMPNMRLGDIEITVEKLSKPSATVSSSFEASDYINKTGNRFFVQISPLNRGDFKIFSANDRKLDIYVSRGLIDCDTVTYTLPEGFVVESLPKELSLVTIYGSLETNIRQEGGKIIYTQRLAIVRGCYDKSGYKDLKDFFAQIDTALKRKMVIRKE